MREAGLITICDAAADKPLQEIPTLQCMHCGCHFPFQPGSKRVSGFCTRCNGPVCGRGCAQCVPMEQQLSNIEAGRPRLSPGKIIV